MLEKNVKKLKNIYFDAHFHWNFANFSTDFCKNSTQNDDFSIYGCSCAHSVEEWNFQFEQNQNRNPKEKADYKVFNAFGIHPQQVSNNSQELMQQIDFLNNLIKNKNLIAIGEMGFDFFSEDFKQFALKQEEIWNIQLELAIQNQLPIVVHCRKSNEKLFEYKKQLKKVPAVLFHSFMGSFVEAQSLIKNDINCFFSFGKQIFNNNKKVIQCVKELPIKYLLLETDAPYQFLKGETETFCDQIVYIYKGAYNLRNTEKTFSFDDFCNQLYENAKNCFLF